MTAGVKRVGSQILVERQAVCHCSLSTVFIVAASLILGRVALIVCHCSLSSVLHRCTINLRFTLISFSPESARARDDVLSRRRRRCAHRVSPRVGARPMSLASSVSSASSVDRFPCFAVWAFRRFPCVASSLRGFVVHPQHLVYRTPPYRNTKRYFSKRTKMSKWTNPACSSCLLALVCLLRSMLRGFVALSLRAFIIKMTIRTHLAVPVVFLRDLRVSAVHGSTSRRFGISAFWRCRPSDYHPAH